MRTDFQWKSARELLTNPVAVRMIVLVRYNGSLLSIDPHASFVLFFVACTIPALVLRRSALSHYGLDEVQTWQSFLTLARM